MASAEQIISEIDTFLEDWAKPKSKLKDRDVIDFIEKKWPQADNRKYKIHDGVIIIGRIVNEYAKAKDYKNMMRWLEISDLHDNSKKHPSYIRNYYKGECCLSCGNETEAVRYFNLCYAENREYIFTRAPFCYKFFNKHLKKSAPLPEPGGDKETFLSIQLKHWQDFFKEERDTIDFEILKSSKEYATKPNARQKKGLDYLQRNQVKILKSMLDKLLKEYPNLQKRYDYSKEDRKGRMPNVKTVKGFSELLSPNVFYVTSVYKDDIPYIGFSFSCSWDGEHGLGFMTHKNRVVDMGGDEMSFDIARAKEDLKKRK